MPNLSMACWRLRQGVRPAVCSSLSLGTAGADRLAQATLTLWLGQTYSPRPQAVFSFRTPQIPSLTPHQEQSHRGGLKQIPPTLDRPPEPSRTGTPTLSFLSPLQPASSGERRRLAGCNAVFLGTGGQGSPFKLTKIEHQPHIIFLKTRFIEVLSVKIAAVWNA